MKDFMKYVLATVVGLFVFGIIMAVFGLMSIVGMVASGEATQSAGKNSVLVLNLNTSINEQGDDNMLASFMGGGSPATGLNDILSAIKKATVNDNIKGIYIEAGQMSAGFASAQEIRNALKDFKESGKWIVAYADNYTQGSYYLASVADKVFLNPKGDFDWRGLASQPMYMKDLYEKVGIKFQVVKVGTYKSATEMYTETKMSEANREQVTAYVNGLWQNICNAVAESRNLNVDSLNAYADKMLDFEDPEKIVAYGLVDSLIYADQVKVEVKKMLEIDNDKTISQLSVADMKNVKGKKNKGEKIAVYYAYGDIVQNAGNNFYQQGHQIVGTDITADLEKLANDDEVKAVVVRVNSPGGDAYASEQIWHAITNIKEKKPVVISMGDYAASGGYYMSCPASWIVAQPTTLTGSIGIFGVFPDFSELVTKKLGVHFDEVKTNKNSGFGNLMARPFNAEETASLQTYINRGYELFRQRVAEGRNIPVDEVEKIAQGRVWIGQDAIDIKLVDQLASLDDAIAKAAELAGLEEYYTSAYPGAKGMLEQLLSSASGARGNYLDEQMKAMLGDFYQPYVIMKSAEEQPVMQARVPFLIPVR